MKPTVIGPQREDGDQAGEPSKVIKPTNPFQKEEGFVIIQPTQIKSREAIEEPKSPEALKPTAIKPANISTFPAEEAGLESEPIKPTAPVFKTTVELPASIQSVVPIKPTGITGGYTPTILKPNLDEIRMNNPSMSSESIEYAMKEISRIIIDKFTLTQALEFGSKVMEKMSHIQTAQLQLRGKQETTYVVNLVDRIRDIIMRVRVDAIFADSLKSKFFGDSKLIDTKKEFIQASQELNQAVSSLKVKKPDIVKSIKECEQLIDDYKRLMVECSASSLVAQQIRSYFQHDISKSDIISTLIHKETELLKFESIIQGDTISLEGYKATLLEIHKILEGVVFISIPNWLSGFMLLVDKGGNQTQIIDIKDQTNRVMNQLN